MSAIFLTLHVHQRCCILGLSEAVLQEQDEYDLRILELVPSSRICSFSFLLLKFRCFGEVYYFDLDGFKHLILIFDLSSCLGQSGAISRMFSSS